MAEVLTEFGETIIGPDGTVYTAQACGSTVADRRWEGWIEFIPTDGGDPIRTPRETTQPNRGDAEYWANGLSRVYLEGALARALSSRPAPAPRVATAVFDAPKPRGGARTVPAARGEAVLDPYSLYDKGEPLLRQELGALSAWHLVNIITAWDLSTDAPTELNRRTHASLVETIVDAVRVGR